MARGGVSKRGLCCSVPVTCSPEIDFLTCLVLARLFLASLCCQIPFIASHECHQLPPVCDLTRMVILTRHRMDTGTSQLLLGKAMSQETVLMMQTGRRNRRYVLNRCVCRRRARIVVQIIKRYEMLIVYKQPNESLSQRLAHSKAGIAEMTTEIE